MIEQEIINIKAGKKAAIHLKLNAITNFNIIEKLYEASNAGVPIRMIVRGICSLIPGVEGMSKNIEVISVVDKFLEHPRVYWFENAGENKVYISSADFMTRNIENRVEVAVPIYDQELQKQIKDVFEICWNDGVKARHINGAMQNVLPKFKKNAKRSQWEIYDYYKNGLES